MQTDAYVLNVNKMLLRGLRFYIKQLTTAKGFKYLAAQEMGINPTLFRQIEGNLYDKMTVDLLLRVCMRCKIPVTIRLDGARIAEVVFPTLPEDQFGP